MSDGNKMLPGAIRFGPFTPMERERIMDDLGRWGSLPIQLVPASDDAARLRRENERLRSRLARALELRGTGKRPPWPGVWSGRSGARSGR